MPRYAIHSLSELANVVSEIGKRQTTRANRIARSQNKIASALQAAAAERSRLIRLNSHQDAQDEQDTARIYAFLQDHPELRKGQMFELGTGAAGLRTQKVGALHFTIDEDATIAELRDRFPGEFDKLVKTSYSLRKDDLKRMYPEILDQLSTAYAETSESFTIFPHNSTHNFRRPLARIKAVAVKLGLLPEE